MQWEQWRNNSDALVAGPIPAGEYTTLPVALQPSDVALQGSFTIYLGANRGRGQAYPNGAASNLVSYRWDDTGMVTGRCFRSKRLGVSCWTRGYAWRLHLQSVGVGHAIRPIAGLRAVRDEGGVFDVVVNVGGFGQTEEQLVLQSRVRINAGLTLLALGVYTQLALVLKKKQFERLASRRHPWRYLRDS